MMKIRIEWPYGTYDFGNGVPIIDNIGVEVTEEQYEYVLEYLLTIPSKNRPRIKVVEPPYTPTTPPELTYATQAWVADAIIGVTGGATGLQDHIDAAEPHPAYDVDLPSLVLIFENGLM